MVRMKFANGVVAVVTNGVWECADKNMLKLLPYYSDQASQIPYWDLHAAELAVADFGGQILYITPQAPLPEGVLA